jgi:hypothetical protein
MKEGIYSVNYTMKEGIYSVYLWIPNALTTATKTGKVNLTFKTTSEEIKANSLKLHRNTLT